MGTCCTRSPCSSPVLQPAGCRVLVMPLLPCAPSCVLVLVNFLVFLGLRFCFALSGHCLIARPPGLAFSCILGSEGRCSVAACLFGFQKTPLELPIAVIHLLAETPCYQMLDDLPLPAPVLTVAELPPVVCFHTLVRCTVPVTLDGCPAAAAEAVLPAPSPA